MNRILSARAALALGITASLLAVSVAVNPVGTFVYVANRGDKTVSGYHVDATTGVLTPVAGSPFAAGNGLQSVALAQP